MLFCELLVTGVLQTNTAELLLRNQWRIPGRGPATPPPPHPHRGAPTPPLGRMRPPREGLDPPLETARMTKRPLMSTAISRISATINIYSQLETAGNRQTVIYRRKLYIDCGKHVWVRWKYLLWIKNTTIFGVGFPMIWRIMQTSKSLAECYWHLDLHCNSSNQT